MNLTQAIAQLRRANEPVPKPLNLPSAGDVDAAQAELGVVFHPDYRRFLLEASDVIVGERELFVITAPGSHIDLVPAVKEAWANGVPRDQIPFCEDNANYFCISNIGQVVYWDHNGPVDESWPDLASWIGDVWLGE